MTGNGHSGRSELRGPWLRLDPHAWIPLYDTGWWGLLDRRARRAAGRGPRDFLCVGLRGRGIVWGHVNDRESAFAPTACPAVRCDVNGIVRRGRRPHEGGGLFA